MSIRHMSAVLEDPYFGQGDKAKMLVALILADCARSEDGKAWPSIETLARKSRTSVRGAQEACRQLEKDGKIRIEMNGGKNGTNAYFLLYTTAMAAPATVAPPRKQPAEKATEIPAEKPAVRCTQNHQEPSGTIKNGKETNPAHAEFVKLWCDSYPSHHGGKKYVFNGRDARAVTDLLQITGDNPEDLLSEAVAAWRKPNGFYCKFAAGIPQFLTNINQIRNELRAVQKPVASSQSNHATDPHTL